MNLAAALSLCLLGSDPTAFHPRFFEWGRDPSRGILVNRTVGQAPCGAIDPDRPTLVVVHGINPLHPLMHATVAERYAEAVAARWGNGVNVLAWDWNAAAPLGVALDAEQRRAIGQGYALAHALLETGIDPDRIHLIGQSSGCTVAVAAAREYIARTGRRFAQLTLIDPSTLYHEVVFNQLAAGTAAARVQHYWAPGVSGFGRAANRADVPEAAIPGPRRWRGLINPFRSDHTHAVQWHIDSLAR
jgi:hypothetical protein